VIFFYKRINDYRDVMLITEIFLRDKREITESSYNTMLLDSEYP